MNVSRNMYARKIMNSHAKYKGQMKFVDFTATVPVTKVGALFYISNITQGADMNQRIGDDLTLYELEYDIICIGPNIPTTSLRKNHNTGILYKKDGIGSALDTGFTEDATVRCMFFLDSSPNGSQSTGQAPTIPTVLQSISETIPPNYQSYLNVNEAGRYVALSNEITNLCQQGQSSLWYHGIKPLGTALKYNGNSAGSGLDAYSFQATNALWFLVIGSTNSQGNNMFVQIRLRYKDGG